VLHYRTTTTVLLHLSCRHSFCPAFDNPAWRHGPVVSRYRARFPLGGFFLAFRISLPPFAGRGRKAERRTQLYPLRDFPSKSCTTAVDHQAYYLIFADSDCPPCLSGGEGPRPVSSNHMLETTPNPRTSRASLAPTTLQLAKVVNLHECVAALDPCPRPSSPHHTIYPPDPTSTTLDMTLWNLYNTLHPESGSRPPSFRLPF
jgi:hypothetical protein